ncbi:DUF4407 domain-containing protein [Algoriphagus formosus]|uniref:DUF4407 domain-containing protein n=1 Tax=Algoriphagus formosus TaxID=2007308 RepID=UPI000C2954FA|nr:DUF4407 domain-containing protein [Algoriphagus formosus]
MTTILKLFSSLFGYDYEMVKAQPTASRQKIVTMGFLILIPVVLWTFSGFYLAHVLIGIGLFGSILAAAFLGGTILAVDRSFVATPKRSKTTLLKWTRFGFAIISTLLGSLAIDLALFQGDLAEYRQEKMMEEKTRAISEYKEREKGEILAMVSRKSELEKAEEELGKLHVAEMTGQGGSGKAGPGKISDAIEKKQAQKQDEIEELDRKIATKKDQLDIDATTYADQKIVKRQDALLSQLKDLHDFVLKDGMSIAIYGVFFFFILLLEVFFILYKSATGDTTFDQLLQSEEDYHLQKLQSYERRKARILRDQEVVGDDYDKVVRLLDSGRKMRVM